MKTDDLIRVMAADATQERPVSRVLPLALLATGLVSTVLLYNVLDIRPDWAEAYGRLIVLLKQVLPPVLAVAAFGAVVQLARPEGRIDRWAFGLLGVPAVVIAAFWTTALTTPLGVWPQAIQGATLWYCLTFVPLTALPILAGSLWVLRRGASTRPRLTGALAGVLSGASANTVYAMHCPEDSPMFWGVWYVLAILIVAALGAMIGGRVLRW